MTAVHESRHERSNVTLVFIGVFKLIKSISLFALGIGLVHWRGQDLGQVAGHWINTLWVSRPFFDRMISKLSLLDERAIEDVAAGAFFGSALFLVEGFGLCRRKRWAEFLTVGITSSLLPFEVYELFQQPRIAGVAITLVNIAIVWYLIVQLMPDHKAETLQ